jgi:hypothetical protein
MVCWAGGEGFCLREDFGIEIGAVGLGGVCGRIGTARPTSVCPRAFSTLGLLKRLNKDIFEDTRSTFLGGAAGGVCFLGGTVGGVCFLDDTMDGVCDAADADLAGSCRAAVDRLKRHREDMEEEL